MTSYCPVCGGTAHWIGSRHSSLNGSIFEFDRCSDCSFAFVRHPRTDFANLYDADYYAGRGADKTIDYVAEMGDPGHDSRL